MQNRPLPPCLRCKGLLIKEWIDYLEMWRCIACGDRIDHAVVKRRIAAAFPYRPSGLKVFAWLFDAGQKSSSSS